MAAFATESKIKLPSSLTAYIDEDHYQQWLENILVRKDKSFAIITLPLGDKTPLSFIEQLDPQGEFLYYHDKPSINYTIAAGGSLTEINASGENRFFEVEQKIASTKLNIIHINSAGEKGENFYFLGGFSFFNQIESSGWDGFKSASFTLPKRTIVKKGDSTTLSIGISIYSNPTRSCIHEQLIRELEIIFSRDQYSTAEESSNAKTLTQTPATSYKQWKKGITKAQRYFNNNCFDKVVLSRELDVLSNVDFNINHSLHYLRTQYPNCCTYLIRPHQAKTFIGSSPERLLSSQGHTYQTEALAGSMPRGITDEEDKKHEGLLLDSNKNLQEHALVVDHITQTLNNITAPVNEIELPSIKKFENVQHLHTPIRFKSEASPLQILSKLHPTPALGGYPRKETFNYLSNHGLINRGWYGGPIGWVDQDGKVDFTVAIRSGLIDNNEATLFAGCGIVPDSTPKNEWKESDLKFKPMLAALHHD